MINVKRLRCFIGWLAMLLPWLVAGLLLAHGKSWPESISATFYTEACPIFMIILGSSAFLLMYYDGYDKTDDILNTIAGIIGLCICLFPCNIFEPGCTTPVGPFQIPAHICNIIHLISAVLFFALLAYISFFQFTKTSGNITKNKKIRNIIYRICAAGMLGSFLILLLPDFSIKIWLMEAIALLFFGISWLTKSDAYKWLAADPKE